MINRTLRWKKQQKSLCAFCCDLELLIICVTMHSGKIVSYECLYIETGPLCVEWYYDVKKSPKQATGLDAWASRVKCPARFVSHLHEICIYIWVVYSLCFFCCLFITVTWWYVWFIEWASGNQEEVQACLVTLWLFIISCYSLYKTTLGLLCSWFENNPHFHKYSMDFHV